MIGGHMPLGRVIYRLRQKNAFQIAVAVCVNRIILIGAALDFVGLSIREQYRRYQNAPRDKAIENLKQAFE
jgi:hypothetical protein